MYNGASLDDLEVVCCLCFQEGVLTSWHQKVPFHWEVEDSPQLEEELQAPGEQLTLIDMLLIFNNLEELWDERMEHNFCCQNCVDKIVAAFCFYKTIKRATKQYEKLMQQKEAEITAEYLEVDEMTDVQDDDEQAQDVKFQLAAEEDELSAEEFLAAPAEDAQPCHYLEVSSSSPDPSEDIHQMEETNSLFADDCETESLDAAQSDVPNSTTAYLTLDVHSDREEMTSSHTAAAYRKRRKIISTSKCISQQLMADAVFVVPQFLPRDSPSSSQVCTMDYVPVRVKGTDLKHLTEQCSAAGVTPGVDTVYKCQYCPQAFTASTFLITHQHKCHVCQFCTRAFAITDDLFEHMRASHRQHECAICSAEFSSNSNVRSHLKRAHGVELPARVPLLDYFPPGAELTGADRHVFMQGDEVGEYLSDGVAVDGTVLEEVQYVE